MIRAAVLGLAAGALIGWLVPVHAADAQPVLPLTPDDVTNWSQSGAAFDACIAGVELRNDLTICRGLSAWLAQFAGRVAIASKQPAPVQPPVSAPQNAPTVTPTPAKPGVAD